jgi:DNA/RNA endonuclease YhcR with UshA esterase domain
MTIMRTVSILALALLFTFAAIAATPAWIPIAAARQQAQGATVTVIGLVTVPSADFSSSSGDKGFAIQDQTGGIWISVAQNLRLRLGQRVEVTGVLGTSENKLQLVPAKLSDVKVLPGSELRVATGQVGPATLGYVITVEGTVTSQGVEDDLPYGYKLWLDDGSGPAQIYLNATTNIDPRAPHFKPGRRLRVTGFGNQYATAYEVDPRSRKDIVDLGR